MLETTDGRERGIVSVLMVDVVDSTQKVKGLSVDDAEAFSDFIMEYLREPVERLGGFFANFAGDGGTAIFGWPNSLEDHADCAVKAAWDIQNPPDGVHPYLQDGATRLQFRIGIHSGLIGMRRIQLPTGPRFDTSGAVVHLAAQLEKTAGPGAIAISGETLLLCQDYVPVEKQDAERFVVTGSPVKQDFSRLSSKFTSPMFGRDRELSDMINVLSGQSGRFASVAIWGEPGIGKSRLAIEALRTLFGREFDKILVALGDTPDSFRQFHTLMSLIREAFGIDLGASNETLFAAIDAPPLSDETRQILRRTLDIPAAQKTQEESQLTTYQIGRALVDVLINRVARSSTLFVVEDFHKIDPESAQALELLAQRCDMPGLALLVTSRPEAAARVSRVCAQSIELQPLSFHHLSQIIGGRETRGLKALAKRSGGNPLYFEQLLLNADSKNPKQATSIPLTIESLVHARLNGLEPAEKNVAQTLSILGDDAEISLARQVLGMDMEVLHPILATLDRFAITALPAGGRIRFRHALIADACADSLSKQQKNSLHKDAMEAIQALFPDLSGYYERLAQHAEQADLRDHALEFLWMAALQAKRKSANHSLANLFNWAMRLLDGHEDELAETYIDFVIACYDAMQQIGEYDKIRSHMERATALADANDWPLKKGALLCLLGMIYWIDGQYPAGIEATGKAGKISRTHDSLPLGVNASFVKSLSLHGSGDIGQAIGIQAGLNKILIGPLENKRLGTAGIPGVIVRGFYAWACSDTRIPMDWETEINRALTIARSEREYYSEIAALLGQTRCLLRAGDRPQEAINAAERGLKIAMDHGFHAAKAHMAGLTATALARAGDPDTAINLSEACFRSDYAHSAGNTAFFALQAGNAEAFLVANKTDEALHRSRRALETARHLHNPSLISDGLRLRCAVLASAGLKSEFHTAHQDLKTLIEEFELPLFTVQLPFD